MFSLDVPLPGIDRGRTIHYADARSALSSPLAQSLFQLTGVVHVFLASEYVTLTVSEGTLSAHIKPDVFGILTQFIERGEPVADLDALPPADTTPELGDSEIILTIKELLDERIRPAVQGDGGDIELVGFEEESGIVYLRLMGSCAGCPSSIHTLKGGVENMLMHYVPEVQGVQEVESPTDEISRQVYDALVEQLAAQRAARKHSGGPELGEVRAERERTERERTERERAASAADAERSLF